MVSSTSLSMMSTLAGLRRLEAQIYRAMMEVGHPEAAKASGEDLPKPAPEQLVQEAQRNMAQAVGIVQNLDVRA